MTPSTPIQAQQSRQQVTPLTNSRTSLRSQASSSQSMPQSARPSEMSSPSLANTRRPKSRNLNEIDEKDEVDSSAAMEEEIKAIERNGTWELVNLPKRKQVIGVKWVYKTKSNANRKIERHKARLVVKGYKQQHGRDYLEAFTPVVRMETMRTVVAIAT
eukprot:PITA_30830